MYQRFVLILLIEGISLVSFPTNAQKCPTVDIFDKIMRSSGNYSFRYGTLFPILSCDSLYGLLTSYVHYPRRLVKERGIRGLTQLYRDSARACERVRQQLPRDFLKYMQADSIIDVNGFSEMAYHLSKEDIAQLGGRAILLSIYQKKGLFIPLGSFIEPFKLVEILPLYWEYFKKLPVNQNGGLTKASILVDIVRLGDTTGIKLYQQTLWDYTKDSSRIVHEEYFANLLRTTCNTGHQVLGHQLFDILDYVQTHLDKQLYVRFDNDISVNRKLYFKLGEYLYREVIPYSIKNLPSAYRSTTYPNPPYTPEEVMKLVQWSRTNSLQYK